MDSNLKRFIGLWRGHLPQDLPNIRSNVRVGGVGGITLALLSVLVIIAGTGAVIAVNQIKSLKSEVATLERELARVKTQAAAEEEARAAAQRKALQVAAANGRTDSSSPTRTAPPSLSLSPDEIQLVREYIKPAPFAGPSTASPINVGDPVTSGTIPLPSSLTDKVPKLVGARFTIRDGTIVIVKRDSHQADAVLLPR
jgi:hypothetical protein